MHNLQKILLQRLLQKSPQKYAQLTRDYDFDDNVVFHLKKLQENSLVEKKESSYAITLEGIKKITSFDLPSLEDKGLKTFFVGFVCEHQGQYLIKKHQTEKNIFYNLPSGKPVFGEDMATALPRLFFEETDVTPDPDHFHFLSLHLKTIKTSNGETLFDDAFTIYTVEISDEQKSRMKFKRGSEWMTISEVKKLQNCWPEIPMCVLQKDLRNYCVYSFTSDYVLE